MIRIREKRSAVNRSLRLAVLREIPDDASLRQQWNALVARTDQPQVFYTWEWAFAVQRAYASSLPPLLFLAYDEERSLRGIAALATDANAKQGSFLSATTGDYCDFHSSPEDKPAFVSQVLAELQRQGINDLVLTNLPADSDTVNALRRASAENRYHCFSRTAYECAQILFSRLERGEDGRPLAPGKSRIRRFAKAIGKRAVEFDHSHSWDAVGPILPQFMKAHIVRFLEIGRISSFADERRRTFLKVLSKLLSEPQWLVLSRMSAGGRVYAWQYGFRFHDNWFCYQPTFDSSVEKRWPGFCLLTQVIQDATENPALTKVDLGLGSEAYKVQFANATRRTLYFTLHRSLRKRFQESVRYRVVMAIAASPRAERMARGLVEKAKGAKRYAEESGLRKTLGSLLSRIGRQILWREELLFFESDSQLAAPLEAGSLRPIDSQLLAEAAMRYHDDERTLQYLLRSSARLRHGNAEGFALVQSDGTPLHFAWVTSLDHFLVSELNAKPRASAADCVMLFDCWTPFALRGRGFYRQTLSFITQLFRERGKRSWIFTSGRNARWLEGLAKFGFQRRYSLVRWRILGWQTIQEKGPRLEAMRAREISANAAAKRA
jgi:CelD/BcsL family acetyltransferase involved in cellulose biosynthesis